MGQYWAVDKEGASCNQAGVGVLSSLQTLPGGEYVRGPRSSRINTHKLGLEASGEGRSHPNRVHILGKQSICGNLSALGGSQPGKRCRSWLRTCELSQSLAVTETNVESSGSTVQTRCNLHRPPGASS